MQSDIGVIKLAAYLDEYDNIESSCSLLSKNNINYGILRGSEFGNVSLITDRQCKIIRDTIESYNISAIGLFADNNDHARVLNIANYFHVQYIIVNDLHNINYLINLCADRNITLLLEYSGNFGPVDDTIRLLQALKISLLFDPAELLFKKNCDIFSKYFLPFEKYIAAIDICDYKTGYGFKASGLGESNIKQIISRSAYDCWYFLEPRLNHRHYSMDSKADVFKLALDCFKNLLEE